MKILYVVHQYFPEHTTGTEVLTLTTARLVKQDGHQVAIFTSFPEKRPLKKRDKLDSYEYEDVEVWRFSHFYAETEEQSNIAELEYNNREAAQYFKKVLLMYKPDVVHVFHFQRVTASIIQECKDMSIPVVYTPTDFWFTCPTVQLLLSDCEICPGPNASYSNCLKHLATHTADSWKRNVAKYVPQCIFSLLMALSKFVDINSSAPLAMAKALSLREQYLKAALEKVDRILVPSAVMKKKLNEFLASPKNFIDLPFAVELPEKINRKPSKSLRVGYIGTISHIKGPHILTEAVSLLPDHMDLKVLVYGDIDTFPHYSQRIKKHADIDSRIKLCGTFQLNKINEIYSELDVLVIPSIWHENTPLVAYAAQAYGCPIIASRIEGLCDVVDEGKSGVFFKPGSVMELANILQDLHDNQFKLEVMAEQVSEPHGTKEYKNVLFDVYNDVLAKEVL